MKKCLIVTRSFFPAYKSGGPVRSITNLVSHLDYKFDFDIFTYDKDLGDTESFIGVNQNSWSNKFSNSDVYYSDSVSFNFFSINKIFKRRSYQFIYLNSFFDFDYTIKFLFFYFFGLISAKNIILAPRGELTSGAMSFKYFKKSFYLFVFKFFRIHKNVLFHFTSQEEVDESLFFLGNVRYRLVPNMHGSFPSYKQKTKEVGHLKILFLSRISPKKNLLSIFKALQTINDGNIEIVVAGTIDDNNYYNDCLSLSNSLPKNITVNFLGPINRKDVVEVLNNSHLFCLPTLNENYGHSIVEALMFSNIILISDQTPWSDVENHGCYVGKCFDIKFIEKSIRECLALDNSSFNKKTKKAFDYCSKILLSNISKIERLFY